MSVQMRMCLLAVSLAALLIGGCAGDDDDDGSGGGTTSAGFPQVPTARPSLTGMPDALNASGGASTGTGFGGPGGAISVQAFDGRVMRDDGRSRPGSGNNFLTSAVLTDNLVTWTELTTLAPTQTVTSGASVTIVLNGQDFFLPGAATLDLSAAPGSASTLQIETQGAGDVIRLDGDVNGVRLTLDSVSLTLISINAVGNAISVDGDVDLSGYDSGVLYNGGSYVARAYSGGVIQAGTVDTSGNTASAASGGAGGSIEIVSFFGDIILPAGILRADGGTTTGGSTGGNGGSVYVMCATTQLLRFEWGMRTRGGLGINSGGLGGSISVEYFGPLDAFIPFLADSGSATAGVAFMAGQVSIKGLTVQGVVTGSASGGTAGTGGDGGSIGVEGESLFGLAIEVQADGGPGSTSSGGDGGFVSVYTDGAACVNLLVDVSNTGGLGNTSGGDGGNVLFLSYGEVNNVDWTSDGSGGAGNNGNGGNAASSSNPSVFSMSSPYGEAFVDCTFNVTAIGGAGTNGGGGAGGTVVFNPNGSHRHNFTIVADLSGGDGDGGDGGNGGGLLVNHSEAYTADITVSATLDGGDTVDDAGGVGGGFTVGGTEPRHLTLRGGPINARGGAATGTGDGGNGGFFLVGDAGEDSSLAMSNIAMNLSGGTAPAAGVNGGGAQNGAGPDAVDVTSGRVEWIGGSITARGANAGTGDGGDGGTVIVDSLLGGTDFSADIDVSGGDATGNLSIGGSAGSVSFATQSIWLIIDSDVTANGGDGGTAASGGAIFVLGTDWTTFDLNGVWTVNGGAGAGVRAPTGGAGGQLFPGGGNELACVIRAGANWTANGGAPSGAGGVIDVDVNGSAGANLTIEAGANATVLNGAGAAVPANIDLNQNN